MNNKTRTIRSGAASVWGTAASPWKKGVLASAAALALLGVSLEAQALALGAVSVKSYLGEPLRAEIEIPEISSEEAAAFQAKVASPQAFQAAGVAYTAALNGAQVSLHRRPNGQAYLRVVGTRPVNEPFLGVVIEANWGSGRVVRDYTMLVDPPGRGAPPPVTVAQPQVPPPAPAPAPTVATQLPAPAPAAQAPAASGSAEQPVAVTRMPERRSRPARATTPAPAPAATSSGGGDQVTVQRGDTAYGIVSSRVPDGVSLDQMLVALLRANPNAFIRGNVNLMKSGAVLNMPTAEQASAVSSGQARQAVRVQTRDFHAYRRGVATHAARTEVAEAGRSSGGSVQTQVQDAKAAAPAPDRLTISKGGAGAGGSAETKVAQSRQEQAQAERQAELSRNISELSKLQAASGAAPAPAAAAASASTPAINVPTGAPAAQPASAAAVVTAPAPTPAPTPEAAASAASAATAAMAGASAAAESASEAASAAVTAAASAPEAPASAPAAPVAKPKPVPAPAPVEEPSFVDMLMENPLLPAAGLGLIALLAGYGVYRSRKNKQQAAPLDSSFIESRLQPDSFFGASGGQRVNTKEASTQGGNSSMAYSPSQLDAAGDVDPVAEADVYLAYGRDMQAEEILKEALRTHPGRISVYRKLAEIYVKRRDAKALEALASEAYGITQGTGPDWDFIAGLGSDLDPDNQLYKPGGKPLPAKGPAPSGRPSFGADTEPQTAQIISKQPKDSSGAPLDLDLNLERAPVKAATTSRAAPLAAAAGAAAAVVAAKAETSPPAPVVEPTPAPVEARDSAPLDFDLGLDDTPAAPAPVVEAKAAPAAPVASPPPAPAEEPSESGMIEFDMDALSLDPDSRSGEIKTEQLGDDDDDPIGTKLALAQEFHAIGDTDGARALIKEVIAEATGATKARAERFLNELD